MNRYYSCQNQKISGQKFKKTDNVQERYIWSSKVGGGAQATLRSIERAVLFAFLAKYHHHLQFSLLAATGGNELNL